MIKIYFLLFLLFQCSVFSQTGFVSDINPKFKHLHAEVETSVGVQSTEVFDYDLNIFLNKMLEESKTEIKRFSDFNFGCLENFRGFQDRKATEYLDNFCKRKGIKDLIVFYRNNLLPFNSPYQNLHNLKFDFGILTQVRKKKTVYFMNRTLIAYYNSETKKLNLTRIGDNQFKGEFIKINSKDEVVDKNNKLVNSESLQKDFINQYESYVRANFMDALKNIN